jgi:hypothetical protein
MPEYAKLETVDLFLTGVSPAYPNVNDVLDGVNSANIVRASPNFNVTYNSFDYSTALVAQYSYDSVNYGGVICEPLTIPIPPDYFDMETGGRTGVMIVVLRDSIVANAAFQQRFISPNGGANYLFDTIITGDVPTEFPPLDWVAYSGDWDFLSVMPFAQFNEATSFGGSICVQEYSSEPGTFYGIAAIIDVELPGFQGVFNAFTAPFGIFPKACFSVAENDFLTIATSDDNASIHAISWQPETYVNWRDGTFSSTIETVTFDDPEIQALIDAEQYWITPGYNRYDRFFIALYDDSYNSDGRVLEVFPFGPDLEGAPSYRVLNFIPQNSLAEDLIANYALDNVCYAEGTDNYAMFYTADTLGEEIPVYGFGDYPSEPVAARVIPRYVAVKLPCFVNCVPLIDKRK